MKTFLQHLIESDRNYHYRIKIAWSIDDICIDSIEQLLNKYELRDLSSPKKTIIQQHPLDFSDLTNAEVYILDAITGVPISPYVLQQELRVSLGINEKFIRVKTDNDPSELEIERLNANKEFAEEAERKGLTRASLLDTEETYPEDEFSLDGKDLYGDEYNSKFLDVLSYVASSKNKTKPEGLFNWLGDTKDLPKDDFNKDIADAPESKPWWKAPASKPKEVISKAPEGNLDNEGTTFFTRYADATGKKVFLKKTVDNLRNLA